MGKFSGKKLLMLGTNVSSVDILKYANENGAITYAADYFPREKSASKQIATTSIDISTSEVDAICAIVKDEKIDAVLAGISEFNLISAMTVSKKCNLPFYCTKEQWDMVEDKGKFRALCEENSVPTPTTYYCGDDANAIQSIAIEYPVIVKPVDSSASTGITICETDDQLKDAISLAISCSNSNRYIVEQFVDGAEFAAHYTINDGIVTLSSIDNRYPICVNEGNVTSIPVARIYPSSFIEEYVAKVDASMKRLCASLGMANGVLFIQGLYNPQKGFFIFEAGLRSAGESPYRILSRVNGVNYIHHIVDTALSCEPSFDSSKEDAYMNGKMCATVSLVTKGGVVGSIIGYDEARNSLQSVVDSECRYHVGDKTPCGNSLRQIMIRFVLICDSREQLAKDIAYINKTVNVYDIDGNDMVLKFDPNRLNDII